MAVSIVNYELLDGFINNWLTSGFQAVPVNEIDETNGADRNTAIARKYHDRKYIVPGQAVEPGPLEKAHFKAGDYEGQWEYYACREDHLINHSTTCSTLTFLRSWAYTQLDSPSDQPARFTIFTRGPVDMWVNKKAVYHAESFPGSISGSTFEAALAKGQNKILVRFAGIADPECVLVMALKVKAEGLRVSIPTLIPSIDRRNELEAVNETIYLDRDIYAAEDWVYLYWPDFSPNGMERIAFQDVRMQTPSGTIYGQAEDTGRPGNKQYLGTSASLERGKYHAFVMPRAWEFYETNIRVTKTLSTFVMGRSSFSDGPYGTLEERRTEALLDAAYLKDDLFAEIAKMALGKWQSLEMKPFEVAIANVMHRGAGSEAQLLGLLGCLIRFGKKKQYPSDLKEQIKAAALNFRYWQDEPGSDVLDFTQESRQIMFHACEILAGQLYPSDTFGMSHLTGKKHRQNGETRAQSWMTERGTCGFKDWDSQEGYANTLMALSYLVDLAKAEAIWELGSVLMDKIFYSIALNSYKGVFGASQGSGSTDGIKSGLLAATSGITRLMWGMGVFNHHTAGTVSLAMLEKYELPPIIADIAASLPAEMWDREQSVADEQVVNKVTYRTPDYMLSSAQDYCPGTRGSREHIWQATLGPQSVVFVNQPGNMSQNDVSSPSFWLGNDYLPRVAQEKDSLIALYNLPEDAWLGFTHAYFPTIAFDEYTITGNTAFARKGDGYMALTAVNGLHMLESGPTAFRELRSEGKQNAWICQMGRAAVDGDFAAFQAQILAHPLKVDGLAIELQTPRGDLLSLSWEGPFTVNGEARALYGFKHFENPYTLSELESKQMEIRTDDYLLRLNFGEIEQ